MQEGKENNKSPVERKQSFPPYKDAVLRDTEIPPKQLYVKGVSFSERIISGSFVKMSIVYPVILNGLFLNLVSVYTSYLYLCIHQAYISLLLPTTFDHNQ